MDTDTFWGRAHLQHEKAAWERPLLHEQTQIAALRRPSVKGSIVSILQDNFVRTCYKRRQVRENIRAVKRNATTFGCPESSMELEIC